MTSKKNILSERSEPVQDIIERMPQKFGFWVTGIIFSLLVLLFTFGCIIEYPDTETGSITISTKYAPVKLVANVAGKLTSIKYLPKQYVAENEYIAVIENPANTDDVIKIQHLLSKFDIRNSNYQTAFPNFPKNVSLGDINVKYFAFLNALHKEYDYEEGNLYEKQKEGLQHQIEQLLEQKKNYLKIKATRESGMLLNKKISSRDSVLFAQKAAAEEDFDRSSIAFTNSKENYETIINDINNAEQTIDNDLNKIQQLSIQKSDDESQMRLDVLTSYGDLRDEISAWEQHYAFKAPMNGRVEFAKYWKNNQFVQTGEDIFTIIPESNKMIGQVTLPSIGAGKVKVGESVIVKLDNYPFEEYGSVTGVVTGMSLTKNTVKATQGDVDAYLVDVSFPKGLTTNYKSTLEFKYEIKGTADIVSNERNLLERFFDNLRYSSQKN